MGKKFSDREKLLRRMADTVERENFENDGEENGPLVGRKQETEMVVIDNKGKVDENTYMGSKRDRTKENETIREETEWKIIYQNIRGLVTDDKKEGKEKIGFFDEHVLTEKIILRNFTETWFKSEI